ncbi:hypothetical protein GT045_24400 [Streptomyces sp. SID486]|uniref:hypothetical protein n=1 Tax=Streptomyces sp. SID486 TaxID=2690264 RepID=UPI001368246E|nr:hypothetical protein [Streptomyces sp. SID486]MYX97868.1 hypothetical protein [Streptomyces sp. SID486]
MLRRLFGKGGGGDGRPYLLPLEVAELRVDGVSSIPGGRLAALLGYRAAVVREETRADDEDLRAPADTTANLARRATNVLHFAHLLRITAAQDELPVLAPVSGLQ